MKFNVSIQDGAARIDTYVVGGPTITIWNCLPDNTSIEFYKLLGDTHGDTVTLSLGTLRKAIRDLHPTPYVEDTQEVSA